jgi:hypothetical protein
MHVAHLRQQCHNSKLVIFQEKLWKVLKCYNFLRVQRQHNCSPKASFTNCVTTLYLILSCDTCRKWANCVQKCQSISCWVGFKTVQSNRKVKCIDKFSYNSPTPNFIRIRSAVTNLIYAYRHTNTAVLTGAPQRCKRSEKRKRAKNFASRNSRRNDFHMAEIQLNTNSFHTALIRSPICPTIYKEFLELAWWRNITIKLESKKWKAPRSRRKSSIFSDAISYNVTASTDFHHLPSYSSNTEAGRWCTNLRLTLTNITMNMKKFVLTRYARSSH